MNYVYNSLAAASTPPQQLKVSKFVLYSHYRTTVDLWQHNFISYYQHMTMCRYPEENISTTRKKKH